MRAAIILFIMISLPATGHSATIIVPDDYPTIQGAIDAAMNRDTVLVKPGTYKENIDFKGKAITVKSVAGPDVTIIDGNQNGSVVLFKNGEKDSSVLENFTITNGTGTYDPYPKMYTGGGIFCYQASPLIKGNVIKSNETEWGGGVYCYGAQSKPLIENCGIIENKAFESTGNSRGGGILCLGSSAHIKDCLIKGNTVQFSGGGVAAHTSCSPLITGNLFDSNIAQNIGGSFGGGFDSTGQVLPIIINNIFINNRAGGDGAITIYEGEIGYNTIVYNKADTGYVTNTYAYGGGICASPTTVNIHDNLIAYNTALTIGGGMLLNAYKGTISNNIIHHNSATGGTYPGIPKTGGGIAFSESWVLLDKLITNCLIYANEADDYGGGVYLEHFSTCTLLNCTVVVNIAKEGGGAYCGDESNMKVTNSIIFGNAGGEVGYEKNAPVISFSDIGHGYPGTGNIQDNPQFVDYTIGDLHLLYSSPCRNAGTNSAPGLPATDFEGHNRIVDGIVDMGADEFDTLLYYTGDPTPGGYVEIKILAKAWIKPTDLWFSAGLLDPPLHTQYGDWHLMAPVFGPVSFGQMKQTGLKILSGYLPPDPGPYDLNMQVLVEKELTNHCVLEVE